MSRKPHKLDNIDIQILKELQNNGRKSNIELSESTGISPSPCLRRLKALQKDGVIKKFITDIDEKVFGYNLLIFASVSIEVNSEAEREIFEKEISAIPEIREIYALNLESDYIFKLIAKDWLDYKKIINTKISKVPYIKKIRTSATTRPIKQESGFNMDILDL